METDVIHRLRELDNDFYCSNSASFSRTRQRPWEGWEQVLELIPSASSRVIDVACGNMRFERFLEDARPQTRWSFDCLDVCDELASERYRASYRRLDVIEALERGDALSAGGQPYDVAACFGFMHHVPAQGLRGALLESLLGCVREGGTVAVSFWRFAEDAKKLARARETTRRAERELAVKLGGNDFFLGWNEQAGTYRYCHSFTDDELDELATGAMRDGEVVARFRSDGKNGRMNEYMVLRRR